MQSAEAGWERQVTQRQGGGFEEAETEGSETVVEAEREQRG